MAAFVTDPYMTVTLAGTDIDLAPWQCVNKQVLLTACAARAGERAAPRCRRPVAAQTSVHRTDR